mgnify:CR=1 FL=1
MSEIAFVSGHRDVSDDEFEAHYKPLLDNAVKNNHLIVVGDYQGVDYLAQRYLKDINYSNVIVYHMFVKPRYYVEGYATRGGYQGDEERDSAMTIASTYDIAWVRPGKEKSGTAINLKRRQKINLNRTYGKTVSIENKNYEKSLGDLLTMIKAVSMYP